MNIRQSNLKHKLLMRDEERGEGGNGLIAVRKGQSMNMGEYSMTI